MEYVFSRNFNDLNYDDFYNRGYQIIPNIINEEQVNQYKKKLIDVYKQQLIDFGDNQMKMIGEQNTVRSPFLYDDIFYNLLYNNFTMKIVEDILGSHAILSLQNGIIIQEHQEHHQSFYHRDLIYQEFTSSKPLSINIYFCLCDYHNLNGGTAFIPFSHKIENMPIVLIAETPYVKKGSAILFDSMIFHKAGINNTDTKRFGINTMYTLPFIKQQINYPLAIKQKTNDQKLNRLLGFESREFSNVNDFRRYRLNRILIDK